MDLKREKPALGDIEDRRGKSPSGGKSDSRVFRPIQREEKRKKAEKSYRERMVEEIGRSSKSSEEFNKRVSEFEKNLKRSKDEADESANDAAKAWQENLGKNDSADMKKALKDISDTTKKFRDKKFKSPTGYADGGIVRGFGKARGAKPIKVR